MPTRANTCRHGQQVCSICVTITDAARRMSDTINLKITCQPWDVLANGYMAFRLDDGSSNGTIYDSKADAVRFTDEKRHAYFCFRTAMAGANARDCQLFLDMNRAAADAGIPLAEPATRRAGSTSLILPVTAHDVLTRRIEPQ